MRFSWELHYLMLMLMLKVEDPEFALTQLCLTSTRGELGKLPVDQLFKVDHHLFMIYKHISDEDDYSCQRRVKS